MKNKIISLVLAFSVIACLFPAIPINVSAASEGIYSFKISNGAALITKVKNTASGKITIPSKLGGYPVKYIGTEAFEFCTGITELIIPYGVIKICGNAFYGCSSLKSLTIPNSVTFIGVLVLAECENLKNIYYLGTKDDFSKIDLQEDWSNYNIIYHKHNFSTVITKATLSKNGKTIKKCSGCKKTITTINYYPKTISLSATAYNYNGKINKPGVIVKNCKGKLLKRGIDYTLTYPSGCKKVGVYSIIVKLKGNYSGKKTLKYKILPKVAFSSAKMCVKATRKINAESSHIIKYKSSDLKVASVNSKGVITAKNKGTATITVTSNKISKAVKITVSNPYIKLNKSKMTILIGKSSAIKATVFPSSAKITFTCSNTKIAKVSSKGKVTGVNAGAATITATITYKGKNYQKTCKVTVSDKSILKLPATPYVINDDYSRIKITSVSYRIDEKNKLFITVSGKKTGDIKGKDYSRSTKVLYKLYDSAGFVVKSGKISTADIKIGEKFKILDKKIAFSQGIPLDIYKLELQAPN